MSTVLTQPRDHDQLDGPRRTPRLTDRIGEHVSIALGIMWVVGYFAVGALEPVTHQSPPVIAIVLAVAFHLALLAAAAGLIARRRWGITASIGASGLFLAGTVACPTTGHHPVGLWWFAQMAISIALVVASVLALLWSTGDEKEPDLPAPAV